MYDINQVNAYCRRCQLFSIAMVQRKFGLNYFSASRAIDELVASGLAKLCDDGLNYEYDKPKAPKETLYPYGAKRKFIGSDFSPNNDDDNDDIEDPEDSFKFAAHMKYFENRRRVLYEQLKEEFEGTQKDDKYYDSKANIDDKDAKQTEFITKKLDEEEELTKEKLFNDLFGSDDDGKNDIDPEKLYNVLYDQNEESNKSGVDKLSVDQVRAKALKLCIEKGYASAWLLRRVLPITYITACQLIEWMKEKCYISCVADDAGKLEVLISMDMYNKIFDDN